MVQPKIAVVGANGQLGTEICNYFASKASVIPLLHSDVDITSIDSCKALNIKPDFLINTAAFHDAKICENDILTSYRVNSLGTANLASICNDWNAKFIHISTDYVFDGNKKSPYVESDPVRPINIYGMTKALGETLALEANPSSCILRVAGLYGHAMCRCKPRPNFVNLMLKLAYEGKPIKVVSDEYTTPTSTLCVAQQIEEIIQGNFSGVFHATCEGECSWYEFAAEIFRLKGLSPDFTSSTFSVDPNFSRPSYSVLENERLKQLGANKFPHWKEALKCYLLEK